MIAPPSPTGATFGPWTNITVFRSDWGIPAGADGLPGNIFPPQWRVSGEGTVELRGGVEKSGAFGDLNVFDLPAAIRPPTDVVFAAVTQSTAFPKGEPASLGISTGGTDVLQMNDPAVGDLSVNDILFLDGLSYSIKAL